MKLPVPFLAVLLALALAAAACGSSTESGEPGSSTPPTEPAPPDPTDPAPPGPIPFDPGPGLVRPLSVGARESSSTNPTIAGDAVSRFGIDLFTASRAAAAGENVTVSPASVAIALAMLEPGASGEAQTQLRELLGIRDPVEFHAAVNALEQSLESRVAEAYTDEDEPGEIVARIANAAYLQEGYPFEADYLDAIGANYGPVLNEVDFAPDPDAVAHEINDFVAEATNDRIVDILADGQVKPETVLALVNALYLKASWLETFPEDATTDQDFTRLDGSTVAVPMMNGGASSSARGDGWVGATKAYVGNLHVQFILPDEGRFGEVADDLSGVFIEYDANRTAGALLGLPRFETRYASELSATLQSMGLTAPYQPGNLLGVANDPQLVVDQVVHHTFVAMDEEGTEAAAATVILATATSGPAEPPVPVVLDRPFLYRIVDDVTGATLFIGQVTDPTA
ncbi:MAG: serpin family protein [Acidimicrobiales bacterium]|nr:serpin family protein [Acidimicrobiales bacterium]